MLFLKSYNFFWHGPSLPLIRAMPKRMQSFPQETVPNKTSLTSCANMLEEPTKQFSRFYCDRCEKFDGSDGDGDDDFVPQNFTSSVPSLLLYGL